MMDLLEKIAAELSNYGLFSGHDDKQRSLVAEAEYVVKLAKRTGWLDRAKYSVGLEAAVKVMAVFIGKELGFKRFWLCNTRLLQELILLAREHPRKAVAECPWEEKQEDESA